MVSTCGSAATPSSGAAGSHPQDASVPTVEVRELTIRYGNQVALSGISLEVWPNEIFGIIGPANAGKTSFIKALNRMDVFTSGMRVEGDIRFKGREIRRLRLPAVGHVRRRELTTRASSLGVSHNAAG